MKKLILVLSLIIAILLYIAISQYIVIRRLRSINETASETAYDYIRLMNALDTLDVTFTRTVAR